MKPLIVSILSLALFAAPLHAGNCQVLYRRQQVVAPYVQQVVAYAAPVYYSVGQSIQEDAIAERIAAKVAQKIQALQAAPNHAGPGTLQVRATLLTAKCAKCHSSAGNAKGVSEENPDGVVLDGTRPISAETKLRIIEMLGLGKNIPAAMTGVMKMSVPDKGQLTEEVLNLPSAVAEPPPKPEPLPPPEPQEPGTLE